MQRVCSLGERIDEYCRVKKMLYNDLCAIVGLTNRGLANYRQGIRSPTVERCIQMAAAMGVNPMWLQGFDVEMENNSVLHPISITQLKRMGGKAYWHYSIENANNDKWNILPPHVAAEPKRYFYKERWLAFRECIYPIPLKEIAALADLPKGEDRRVWVRPRNSMSPFKEGWMELDKETCAHAAEKGYSNTWEAYTICLRPEAEES